MNKYQLQWWEPKWIGRIDYNKGPERGVSCRIAYSLDERSAGSTIIFDAKEIVASLWIIVFKSAFDIVFFACRGDVSRLLCSHSGRKWGAVIDNSSVFR